jgi:hypothetical protein
MKNRPKTARKRPKPPKLMLHAETRLSITVQNPACLQAGGEQLTG